MSGLGIIEVLICVCKLILCTYYIFLGNTYGRNHTTLSPDEDNEFWEFSYDEMGSQDLPAMIDYILSATNMKSISYIGHSEGTIQVFAAGSDQIKQTKLINIFIALAPVAYVENVRSPEVVILARANMAKKLISRFHLGNFLTLHLLTR